MSVDYDLVILGGSSAGIFAAVTAASCLKARVALVEPHLEQEPGSRECGLLALERVCELTQSMAQVKEFGCWDERHSTSIMPPKMNFEHLIRWASSVLATESEFQFPSVLSALGIDVISGEGAFCREPRLGVMVKGRILRSRRYLIAPDSRWKTVEIEGLARVGYLTPETLSYWIKKGQPIPENWVILGHDPKGVELAQNLAQLGNSVTLIVSSSTILPYEDPEMARWVQAQLEADGVNILTQTQVTQVKKFQGKKWVQAGDLAIETDEILLTLAQVASLKTLKLDAVGVRRHRHQLLVNSHLQTTHPQVYACGCTLGGYSLENISHYEAKIAIQNALIYPRISVDYSRIPWSIGVEPPLARVGYTEPQARLRYGDDLTILKSNFNALKSSQRSGKNTGFCKVIVHHTGELIGVHIWGAAANELIHPFALAKQQRLKLDAIGNLFPVSPSFSEIYQLILQAWYRERHQHNPWWQTGLKLWHNWQRDIMD